MEEVGARVSIKGARKAQKDADKTARSVRGIGDEGAKASRRLGGLNAASRRLGGGLGTLGSAAGLAIAGGTALTVAFGVKAYRGFDEGRRVIAQTEAAIKSTGGAANVTADQVTAMSLAMTEKNGVDDAIIQQGANLLLTFKNVRNEVGAGNDVFSQATQAAVDLSAAGFGSVDSAAKMLGKALSDPLRGITALHRAGVSFTDQQRAQIEALVETGDTLEAQLLIMREVESQVGGSAAAQASDLDRLRITVDQLTDSFGAALFPATQAIAGELHDLGQQILPDLERAGKRVGNIFGSDALNLGQKLRFSGRALEQEVGPELRVLVAQVERELSGVDAGAAIRGAVEKGAPVMADALAAQVPNMASAFVTAFKATGPEGQLLTAAVIAAKLGAFKGVGALASGWFAASFGGGMAAATPAMAAGSAAYGRVVGKSFGSAAGTVAAADMVRNASLGTTAAASSGKFDKAGRAMGVALGAAAAVMIVPAIRDVLVDAFPDLARYSGWEGWGNLTSDLMGGSPSGGIGSGSRGATPATPQQRRDAGAPPGAQVNAPAPRAPSRNPLVPQGPLVTRGAQFALPEGSDEITFSGPLIIQMGDDVVHRQTVKVQARRQRRK